MQNTQKIVPQNAELMKLREELLRRILASEQRRRGQQETHRK